ncbi:MAG: hypothetical protein ACRDRL_02065 [Sciscionella sp.]
MAPTASSIGTGSVWHQLRVVSPAEWASSRCAADSHALVLRDGALWAGTVAQAAKMPILAVTPTEVFEAMHHCMPSEA